MQTEKPKPLIFETKPAHFNEMSIVSGFYCLHHQKVLLLKRHPEKLAGGFWCLPGGKKEEGESPKSAAIRELKEEVGIKVKEEETVHLGTLYIQFPEIQYSFYIYRKEFVKKPLVTLNLTESSEARWVSLGEAKQLPIIHDAYSILEYCNNKK